MKKLIIGLMTVFILLGGNAQAQSVLIIPDYTNDGVISLAGALQGAGYNVTVRPGYEYTYDETNPSAMDYNVIIHMNGATYYSPMTVAGQFALVDYVNAGGGFIGSQWDGFEERYNYQVYMPDLVLFSHGQANGQNCGSCYVTYSVEPGQEDHPIVQGLPPLFTFFAGGHDASPKAFTENPPSAIMRIGTGAAGVLTREVGSGRVVNFSIAPSYYGWAVLTDPNIQRLYINAVAWASGSVNTNNPPVADAGNDQSIILVGSTVELGTDPQRQSYDPEGDALTYAWAMVSQPENSYAVLFGADSATPSFVADINGTYLVELVVTDVNGASSAPDQVEISFTNLTPVAEAGDNQAVVLGDSVTLTGSGNDANNDTITYGWSLELSPEGSTAALSSLNSAMTGFTPDMAGTYSFSLVVNDGLVDSEPDLVTLTVITAQDATTSALVQTVEIVNDFPVTSVNGMAVLKNKNMAKPLTNKINSLLESIENGEYAEALDKINNDLLSKTDGCATQGSADKNDWVRTCPEQEQIYPVLIQTLDYLNRLLN